MWLSCGGEAEAGWPGAERAGCANSQMRGKYSRKVGFGKRFRTQPNVRYVTRQSAPKSGGGARKSIQIHLSSCISQHSAECRNCATSLLSIPKPAYAEAHVQLALVHFPIAFLLVSELKQPVARVVALAAGGAREITAQLASMLIEIARDRKSPAATARHQVNAQILIGVFAELLSAWH